MHCSMINMTLSNAMDIEQIRGLAVMILVVYLFWIQHSHDLEEVVHNFFILVSDSRLNVRTVYKWISARSCTLYPTGHLGWCDLFDMKMWRTSCYRRSLQARSARILCCVSMNYWNQAFHPTGHLGWCDLCTYMGMWLTPCCRLKFQA